MGIQYRTGIFYTEKEQLPVIQMLWDREAEKAGAPLAVIMEALGGGGHQSMAACQLPGETAEKATEQLRAAINAYLEKNS